MGDSKKIWYAYFSSDSYCDSPSFFNTEEFEWGEKVIDNYPEIEKEVRNLIQSQSFTPQNYFIEGLNESTNWRTFSFMTWGIKVKKALRDVEAIDRLIRENPSIVSVSINFLGPNSEIKTHHGDSNAFYRCHLGIDIPGKLPLCGFQVNDDKRCWEEGQLLIFTDANKHKAWNYTDENRVILLFDIIKKEYLKRKFMITIRVRAFLVLQFLIEKYPRIKKKSKLIHRIINFKLILLLIFIYPYQKVFGVIKSHN